MTDTHSDQASAVAQLVSDLQWQIDQLKVRDIRDHNGRRYVAPRYRQGLRRADERGGLAAVEYLQRMLHGPTQPGYATLEAADALDLTFEWLVRDHRKPYAWLFSDEDRMAAEARLGPHVEAIEGREAERRSRVLAMRNEMRAERGLPPLTDAQLDQH